MSLSVLLVDDDPPVLQTLKTVFETRDFNVATAISARDAVLSLGQGSFDLVVTDMRMETPTSGLEVVRTAKEHPDHPVVVILTAFPIPAPEWRAAGADALFVKGGGIVRILDDLEQLLKTRQPKAPSRISEAASEKAG